MWRKSLFHFASVKAGGFLTPLYQHFSSHISIPSWHEGWMNQCHRANPWHIIPTTQNKSLTRHYLYDIKTFIRHTNTHLPRNSSSKPEPISHFGRKNYKVHCTISSPALRSVLHSPSQTHAHDATDATTPCTTAGSLYTILLLVYRCRRMLDTWQIRTGSYWRRRWERSWRRWRRKSRARVSVLIHSFKT